MNLELSNFESGSRALAFLKAEFSRFKQASRRGSLRQFAKKLDISPSYISVILSGKRSINENSAKKISNALFKHDSSKGQLFYLGFQIDRSPPAIRDQLIFQWDKMVEKIRVNEHQMRLEYFATVGDILHQSLLASASIRDLPKSYQVLAERFETSEEKIEAACQRLVKLGMLKHENGEFIRTHDLQVVESPIPSPVVQRYQKEGLQKSIKALSQQDMNKRDFQSMTFSLNPKFLPRLQEKIAKFITECYEESESFEDHSAIYQLQTQLFRLDNGAD